MPFTISHTAAVLPFLRHFRRWRVASALVIGSMAPDFGFLLPWRMPRFETHSAIALLTFSLPAGLVTYWLFQRVIKSAVREVLPDGAYQRSQESAAIADTRSPWQWAIAALAILAGALTHLVLDAFTHEGARGVHMLPVIDDWLIDVAGHRLPGTRFLQDASSVVGMILVVFLLVRALRKPDAGAAQELGWRRLGARERSVWRAAYALTAITVATADFLAATQADPIGLGISHNLAPAAIASLRGLAASLLGVSILLAVRLRSAPS
jgi:hypothetical protein